MSIQVMELLSYRLQPHLNPDAYLAIVAATAPALHGQPGLLSRDLAVEGDTWTEVIRWASQAHADAAGQAIMANPDVAPLMAALDMASLSLRFVPIVWHKSG